MPVRLSQMGTNIALFPLDTRLRPAGRLFTEDTDVANQDQHDGANGSPQLPSAAPDAASNAAPPAFAGAARRRFATKGAAALGAILTVKSQPGMACTICHSPSGFASGNLNSHNPHVIVCAGLSPGYWKTHPSNWHSSCVSTAKFRSKFTCSYSSGFYNKSMITMCDPQSFDKNNVAMHCVAAYQNALAGKTSFLSAAKVQAIWNEYWATGGAGVGYYTPMAGKKWYGAEITAYLRGTMD
jgi:hypothetical protein